MAKQKIKVNQVVISGYVPKDPFVNEAKTFLAFSVGYDKSYRNQQGEWVNLTAWIPVKLWASNKDRIERLTQNLKAGVSVVVIGQIDQNSSKDKNGNIINDVFLKAESIQVYDGKNGSSTSGTSNDASYASNPGYISNPDEGEINFDFMNGNDY